MSEEKNDAQNAPSGLSQEVLAEIAAQHAILDSALKLINQHHQDSKKRTENASQHGEWVYNMGDLAHWVHHYTKRRRLYCPHCKADTTVTCETCNEVYEYHDEL